MGITVKRINGTEYLYFTQHDKDTNTTRFYSCGAANTTKAQLKAMRLEYDRLERYRSEVTITMKNIQSKMVALEQKPTGTKEASVSSAKTKMVLASTDGARKHRWCSQAQIIFRMWPSQ